jgi:hypothetical protein
MMPPAMRGRHWLALCALLAGGCCAAAAEPKTNPRSTVVLDGVWQIAEGTMNVVWYRIADEEGFLIQPGAAPVRSLRDFELK